MIAAWLAVAAVAGALGIMTGDTAWPIIGLMALVGMGVEIKIRRIRDDRNRH